MCGQFLALKHWRDFLKSLGMSDEAISEIVPAATGGTIRPTDTCPIITAGAHVTTKHWGLIPNWSNGGIRGSAFNARIETAAEKPTFRDAFAHRRALVPAAGFYEWAGGRRHLVSRQDGEALVFAGLWEGDTFTILTRAARADMAALHEREPVLVGRRQWHDWLDNALSDPSAPPDDFFRIEDADDAPMQAALF